MKRLLIALLCLGCAAAGWAADTGEPLLEFLAAARNIDVALKPRTLERLNALRPPPMDSPRWAVDTFLRGEVHRIRGEQERATGAYRSLVDWAVSDDMGGSGLAGIALWRLLDKPRAIAEDKEAARALLEIARQLLDKPLVKRYFADPRPRVRVSLSRFKGDIVRQLIVLAAGIGDDDTAMQWFIDSIALRTDARVTSLEAGLLERALAAGRVTRSGMVLKLARRLIQLGHFRSASGPLNQLRNRGETSQIRVEAGLLLARLWRGAGRERAAIIELLDEVQAGIDDGVADATAQEVYYQRAIRHNREGAGRNRDFAVRDFEIIIEKYPQGVRADNALYQLGRLYEREDDIERAMSFYERLQDFQGRSDRADSAYFSPALMHYARPEATALLESLIARGRSGALYRHGLFWLARVHEAAGDREQARAIFNDLAQGGRNGGKRFDYYALRSRMHLNMGPGASGAVLPDKVTLAWLRHAYEQSLREVAARAPAIDSIYLKRVDWALRTGLYAQALDSGTRELLRRGAFLTQRNDPFYLAETGVLTPLVVQFALLHDALTADELRRSIADCARIAWRFAEAGDWPGSLRILGHWGTRHDAEGWLAAAYPSAYFEQLRQSGARHGVPPALLYAVMKRESWFSLTAHSPVGALGLFQFMPTTFYRLDEQWNFLAEQDGVLRTMEGYLSDPDASIELGARWFRDSLLSRYEGTAQELLAVMEHNAGPEAVDEWVAYWDRVGRHGDIEYMVETTRYLQTRVMLREALVSMAVAEVLYREQRL